MTPIRRTLPCLLLVAASTACFHYVPSAGMPSQGTPVRAYLNRPVPVELADITANNIVEVRGEFVTARPDQLILSAFALQTASDVEHRAGGATVYVPRDALRLLEERRISAGRTAVAVGALAGAGYLIQLGLRSAFGGGEGGNGGGATK